MFKVVVQEHNASVGTYEYDNVAIDDLSWELQDDTSKILVIKEGDVVIALFPLNRVIAFEADDTILSN